MISPAFFFQELVTNGVDNFSGVPDSLLKNFCAYVADNSDDGNHIITANEGSAIGLAAGQYAASGNPSLVYMQNSGFGNALNPLLSLADTLVYGVPMLVMVGWRGEPGVKDEPQHIKQGAVMESLLLACEIPYYILDSNEQNVSEFIAKVTKHAKTSNCPVVILVRKNTFSSYTLKLSACEVTEISRESAIEEIVNVSTDTDVFVSTTGMPSRELFEIRERRGENHNKDFLTVGSMGHASMIALGISQTITSGHIFCIDGDGASLMHMGNMTTIGQSDSNNLIHIVLNNGAHDSVGGQPTCANDISLPGVATSSGYRSVTSINRLELIGSTVEKLKDSLGPHFLEIKIKTGARSNLGRPTSSPRENLGHLMQYLEAKIK
jgi:phosphonopyruvate decarboxylase